MDNTQTIVMFDATLQRDVDHTIGIDGAGEIVLTSVESGHFVKLPAGTTPDQLKAFIDEHKAVNEGKVTAASLEAKKAELLAAFAPAPASV